MRILRRRLQKRTAPGQAWRAMPVWRECRSGANGGLARMAVWREWRSGANGACLSKHLRHSGAATHPASGLRKHPRHSGAATRPASGLRKHPRHSGAATRPASGDLLRPEPGIHGVRRLGADPSPSGSSLRHGLNPMDPRLAVPRNFVSLRETRLAVPRNFVSLRETRFRGDDDAAVHGCCVGARALQRHRGRVVGWQSGWKSPDGWPDS